MKSKIKLLVLTNMYPSGSHQKGVFVKELVECVILDQRIDQVSVFNIDEVRSSFLKYILSVFSLFYALKRQKVDVINVHYGLSFVPLFFLLPYIWFNRIKVVSTFHGSDLMGIKLVNIISNLAIFFSNQSIIVSKCMIDYIWTFQRNDVRVVSCGVDAIFKYVDRPKWDRCHKLTVIFPSSPSRPEKNYHLFRDVVERLMLKRVDVEEICFENLSRIQIFNALSDANILFLSSLREGSPQVVKEAVLTGLPVISTDVGDVVDILAGIPEHQAFISSNPDDIVEWILTNFIGLSIEKSLVDIKCKKYSNLVLSTLFVDILYHTVNFKKC
ncbi:glycosyltransferase [Vibrio sp. TRT 29B02]|uniref:glycosyltransferase n=1 Tax=Vibrio sp. TRT 29B02 TaxID=3418508 RepID=UPI003CF0A5B7